MSLDNIHRDGDAVVLGDHVLGHGQHGLGVHPHPRNLKSSAICYTLFCFHVPCYTIKRSPCIPRCVRCGRWGPRPCPPSRSRSPSSTGTGAPSLEWLELWNKSDNNKINAKKENLIVKVWGSPWHCDNIPAAANLFYYNPIWNKISTLISSYFSFHFRRGCLGSRRWTQRGTPCN